MDQTTWRSFQDAVDGTLRCLARLQKRSPMSTAPTATTNASKKEPKELRPNTKPSSVVTENVPYASAWGRWKTRLWSYYQFRNKPPEPLKNTPQTPIKDEEEVSSDDATEDSEYYDAQNNTTTTELSSSSTTSSETNVSNVKSNGRMNNGTQVDVASGQLVDEKEEYVPDEEATVADDEDIKYTSYNLSIHHGSLSLYEYVDGEKKGLIKGSFQDLLCSFFPKLPSDKKFSEVRDERNNNNNNDFNSNSTSTTSSTSNTEPLTQAEAHITINSYSIVQLDYGPSRHPDFIKLVDFSYDGTSPVRPMFSMSFIYRHFASTTQNKINQRFARELELDFHNCTVIFDKEVWERIYLFFFGGRKGKRLQRFMEQNLENTLQTALSEYVKFRIEVTNPMVILPQFATTRDHLISLLKSHAFRLVRWFYGTVW